MIQRRPVQLHSLRPGRGGPPVAEAPLGARVNDPVECGRSRQTAQRSDLAGWPEYGYCASHSRYFWGPRLHLVCTLHGLPIGWSLTGAKADERHILCDILTGTTSLAEMASSSPTIIADKNHFGRVFEADLANAGIALLRP